MSEEDVKRYLDFEAPGIGMVANDVAAVVCFRDDCSATVGVDPASLVPEPKSAVDVESETADPDTLEPTGESRVEIYCSTTCRNAQYNVSIATSGDLE